MIQMKEYPKINTIYKRGAEHTLEYGKLLLGQWSQPEFQYLKDCVWVGTEKVDGTNIRIVWQRGQPIQIGGKTDNAQIYVPLLTRCQELFGDGKIDKAIDMTKTEEMTLYGEGYGAKIQKGGGNYKPDGVDFVLFDIRIGDWWLEREAVQDISKRLQIQVVPVIYLGNLEKAAAATRAGFDSLWGDFLAEGMVLRPLVELKTRSGHRIITKIKNKDFKDAIG